MSRERSKRIKTVGPVRLEKKAKQRHPVNPVIHISTPPSRHEKGEGGRGCAKDGLPSERSTIKPYAARRHRISLPVRPVVACQATSRPAMKLGGFIALPMQCGYIVPACRVTVCFHTYDQVRCKGSGASWTLHSLIRSQTPKQCTRRPITGWMLSGRLIVQASDTGHKLQKNTEQRD